MDVALVDTIVVRTAEFDASLVDVMASVEVI